MQDITDTYPEGKGVQRDACRFDSGMLQIHFLESELTCKVEVQMTKEQKAMNALQRVSEYHLTCHPNGVFL